MLGGISFITLGTLVFSLVATLLLLVASFKLFATKIIPGSKLIFGSLVFYAGASMVLALFEESISVEFFQLFIDGMLFVVFAIGFNKLVNYVATEVANNKLNSED